MEERDVTATWEWVKEVKIAAVGGDAQRAHCSRVLDADRGRIVLFGGKLHAKGSAIGTRSTPQALCMAYSLEEKAFSPLRTKGALPPCLYGHSACVCDNLMYVFGGRDIKTGEVNSTLYALDLETLKWSIPLFAGEAPSGRYGHTCTVYESQLVIFGGMSDENTFLSDAFLLHTNSRRWISLPSGPAKAYHAVAMLGETMLVYGGRDSLGTSRDVFLLDCLEGEWSLEQMFSAKSTAVPDRRECTSLVPFDGRIVVVGGSRGLDDSSSAHIPVLILSVDGDMLQWNVQKTTGAVLSYGDVSAFLVSDGDGYVILAIGDCGVSFLATGIPLPRETALSDSDDEQVTQIKHALKSASAGQLGILNSFGIGRRKPRKASSSKEAIETVPADDLDSLSLEELRELADRIFKVHELNFRREKSAKVAGKDLILLQRLLQKERRRNEEYASSMEDVKSVVDKCYDLSACAERQQRKLARQGAMLEASLEHCKDDLAVFQTITTKFIKDKSQRDLSSDHLRTVLQQLESCKDSLRYLCQAAELPRIGTLPAMFSSPRGSPRTTVTSPGGFFVPGTVSPRSPRRASPRSPRSPMHSPKKEDWRRRSRSLLRSTKEANTIEQPAVEDLSVPSRRSSDTASSRAGSSGEWSPRRMPKSASPRNPSPGTDPNGSKKELIMSLSSIEDPHRRKEADALVRELGSDAPKLVNHSKIVFVLEAHAAAAGDPSALPKSKTSAPAVPPRAGRRSLQMNQEGFKMPGVTRQLISRASTTNMIEMCKALESAEPSQQYNLVVKELLNTERQFVSDMLAVNMMFMKPLQDKLKGVVSEQDFHSMFGNSMELLEKSRQFLSEVALEAAKPPETQKFGDLFTSALQSMFPQFVPYCTNLLHARRTKSRLARSNAAFLEFLATAEKDPRCQSQDLKSYLIKPLQRLCKYPLLLSEMHKHCAEHQKVSLARALEDVRAFVADVNEKLLKDEDMEPLYEIQDLMYPSLSGVVPKVAVQGRRLLASCQVLHLVSRKGSKKMRLRPSVLYLMSDVIILCEEAKGRNLLRCVLPVEGATAEPVAEEAFPALKGRTVGFVLELKSLQSESIHVACSDPTELASLRHALAAARS